MSAPRDVGDKLPRRDFVRGAAATAAALALAPRAFARPKRIGPSDRVNIAFVGCGGMGRQNLAALSSENLVALCDVDWGFADSRFADIANQITQAQQRQQDEKSTPDQKARAAEQLKNWQQLQAKLPKAKRHTDYREMLEKQKDIDACSFATNGPSTR